MGKYTTVNCIKEDKKRLKKLGIQIFNVMDADRHVPEYLILKLLLDFAETRIDQFLDFVKQKMTERM